MVFEIIDVAGEKHVEERVCNVKCVLEACLNVLNECRKLDTDVIL